MPEIIVEDHLPDAWVLGDGRTKKVPSRRVEQAKQRLIAGIRRDQEREKARRAEAQRNRFTRIYR